MSIHCSFLNSAPPHRDEIYHTIPWSWDEYYGYFYFKYLAPPFTANFVCCPTQELCDSTVADALAGCLWHDPTTKQPHLHLILGTLGDIARGVAFIHSKNIIHGARPQCGEASV